MKIAYSLPLLFIFSLFLFAGGESEAPVDAGGRQVIVEPGEHYRHPFPLFLGIKIKNPPQMAIWAESLEGEYLGTMMVTEKTSSDNWAKAPKDSTPKEEIRRPEALPVWSHRSGSADTAPDAVSRATPKDGFSVAPSLAPGTEAYYLYFEVNHSTDFNAAYPADADPDASNYNGGRWGSGQPALVYRLIVDSSVQDTSGEALFELLGHSSPDGSDGKIYSDLAGIDTALEIVESIRLE